MLIESMKIVLADAFCLYLKAHHFHWNVEGPTFPMFHSFFGDLYTEIFGSIDSIAEHIRVLGSYAPGSLSRFQELTTITDEMNIPSAMEMTRRLHSDNQKLLFSLKIAQKSADDAREVGISNFLQDRIDIHMKHQWQLASILKNS